MAKQYAVKDRDGTIHAEPSRRDAQRSQKAYGGIGKGIGVGLVVIVWVVVDFLLAVSYGIYRLARR